MVHEQNLFHINVIYIMAHYINVFMLSYDNTIYENYK